MSDSRTIGHYTLTRLLGRGGMGDVFVAHDETLHRQVAIKSIRAERRLNEQARTRFLREARMLSSLDHPHICRVYDYLQTAGADYLVMEFIEGERLERAISRGLSNAQRLRIAEQIAGVLVAAHAEGIVHRDLKPDNVMLMSGGDIKVLDFGLARPVDRKRSDDEDAGPATSAAPDRSRDPVVDSDDPDRTLLPSEIDAVAAHSSAVSVLVHTADGQVMGTPLYMSPEQAAGKEVTAASDMYSFGLLLQAVWTGEEPYEPTQTMGELLIKVQNRQTLPVRGVGGDLTRLINDLKSAEPSVRPTAVEAEQRLRWIIGKPRRRIRNASIAALLLIAVLAGLKYTLDLRRERNEAVFRRGQADELITFMLDELHTQLQPVGQTSALAGVGERALAYLASVPEEEMGDDDLARRAQAQRTIGIVHIEQGNIDAAETALLAALEDDQALVARNDRQADWESGRGFTQFYLGNVHYIRGDYDLAVRNFQAYLESSQRLTEIEPKNDNWQLEVAMGHTNLGAVHEARGAVDEAHAAIVQANEIKRALADRTPEDGDRQRALANGLSWQASVELQRGQPLQSLATRMEELAIREKSYQANPRDTRGWMLLSTGHNHLSELFLLLGRHDEALHHARTMNEYAKTFVEHDALNTEWQRELGVSHSMVSVCLHAQDRLDEALLELESGVRIVSDLLATDESSLDWAMRLAQMKIGRARVLTDLDRHEDAWDACNRATVLIDRVRAESPESRDALHRLSQLHAATAQLMAVEGQSDDAVATWHQCIEVLEPIAAESTDPQVLLRWVIALDHAGINDRAERVRQQLEAMGVQPPQTRNMRLSG